jgi:hypothetical protein
MYVSPEMAGTVIFAMDWVGVVGVKTDGDVGFGDSVTSWVSFER